MKTHIDGNTATAETPGANGNGEGEPDMMAVAIAADNAPESPLGTEATPNGDAPKPDADKTAAGKKDAKPGEEGNGKPPADGSAKPEVKKDGEPKPGEKSDFAKAKGEQERRDKSWAALEKEKQEFRQERAAVQAELQGLRREVSQLRTAKPAGPATDSFGLKAEDYDKIAKEYKDAGEDKMATAASERAEQLRKQQPATETAAVGEAWKTPEFRGEWDRHTQEIIAKDQTMADPANPLVKATNALIADPTFGRFFKSSPDGIKAAHEVAMLMQRANAAEETGKKLTATEGELKTAKAEIDRLNGLLQPRGSHPAGPVAERKPGDTMTDDDVHAIAAAADRGELDK